MWLDCDLAHNPAYRYMYNAKSDFMCKAYIVMHVKAVLACCSNA